MRLTLRTGSRRLDIETDFNNRAFDHRLRAWFPTGLATDEVISDGHFMLNRRPVDPPLGRRLGPARPAHLAPAGFLLPSATAQAGLAVFNRGLPEFETFERAKTAASSSP